MRFTQKTDYAFRVMRYLANQPPSQVVPAHRIAENQGLSARFLQGVVRELVVRGILRSVPGPSGGISLAKDTSEISFKDVVEAVEGPVNLMSCMEDSNFCGNSGVCYIQSVLIEAQNALYGVLENHNVSELRSAHLRSAERVAQVQW